MPARLARLAGEIRGIPDVGHPPATWLELWILHGGIGRVFEEITIKRFSEGLNGDIARTLTVGIR